MKKDRVQSMDEEKLNRLTSHTIVKACGLPFSVIDSDLVNFFAEFNVSKIRTPLFHCTPFLSLRSQLIVLILFMIIQLGP